MKKCFRSFSFLVLVLVTGLGAGVASTTAPVGPMGLAITPDGAFVYAASLPSGSTPPETLVISTAWFNHQ